MKLLWLEGQPPPGRGRSTNTPRPDSSCTSPSSLCSLGSDPHLHIHTHTLACSCFYEGAEEWGSPAHQAEPSRTLSAETTTAAVGFEAPGGDEITGAPDH